MNGLLAVDRGEANGRQRIQSVARALEILRQVAASPDGLTPRQLSERVGLTRPTTYHLVNTLVDAGFLAGGDGRRFRLGFGVGALAESYRRQQAPPEHLLVAIRRLSVETGEAAYVVGWSDGEIVVLARVPGQHLLRISEFPLGIGMVGDAHARASGKLLLALAPSSVREDYLRSHPPQRRTPATLVDREELEFEFDRIRELGYAIDREELALGVCCMAAPIDGGGSPFAISISTPKERFVENFDSYLNAVLTAQAAALNLAPVLGSGESR